jgi:hypothetical protein
LCGVINTDGNCTLHNITRAKVIVIHERSNQYIKLHNITITEMGGAFNAYWEGRGVYRVLVGRDLRERDCWGDPRVDGRIILRWIFRQCDVGLWTGLSWPGIGRVGGHL